MQIMLGGVLIFREGQVEKSGKIDQKQGIPLGKWEILSQNFGKSPWYLFLDMQLQFCCIINVS